MFLAERKTPGDGHLHGRAVGKIIVVDAAVSYKNMIAPGVADAPMNAPENTTTHFSGVDFRSMILRVQ